MTDDWIHGVMSETHLKVKGYKETDVGFDELPTYPWDYKMSSIVKIGNEYSFYITCDIWRPLQGGKVNFYGKSKFTIPTLNGTLFNNIYSRDAAQCVADSTFKLFNAMRSYFEQISPDNVCYFPSPTQQELESAARGLLLNSQN